MRRRALHRLAPLLMVVVVVACTLATPLPTPPVSGVPVGLKSQAPGGSPTGVSSATGTPAGSGKPGQLQPTKPPTAPPGPPTSEQLIDGALAAGQIDGPTAMLYKVWSAFGDPQLPAQYQGAAPAVDDPSWMDRLAVDHGDIPDATWTKIQPYVLRPEDPGSAFYPAEPAAFNALSMTGRLARTQPHPMAADPASFTDCDADHVLASVLGTANFRVAAPCTGSYKEDLMTVAAAIDKYWNDEVSFIGPPIADDGTGGSDRIDFYLVDSKTACPPERDCPNLPTEFDGVTYVASPRYGSKSSSFVIIPRSIVNVPLKLETAVVHEFWHVLQHAHNWQLYEGATTYWFVEASATWAEAHFVPEAAVDEVYNKWFSGQFQKIDQPLNQANGVGGNQAYRSFIWPYFMQQESGGKDSKIVGQAWTALESANSYESADGALNGMFSFDEHFTNFAFRNINEELQPNNPIDPTWAGLDGNFPVAKMTADSVGTPPYGDRAKAADVDIHPTPTPTTVDYEDSLLPLTSHYQHFTVANETQAVSIDLSQLDGGDVIASALVHLTSSAGDKWERRDLAPGLTTWCVEDPDNHVDQFTLVISNAAYQDGSDTHGHYSVTGRDSCAQVHGTIVWTDQVTHTDGFGTGHGTNTIWLDLKLKEVGPDTFVDDGSSYSVHGSYSDPDHPAASIYDCATINSFQAVSGTGTFLGPGNAGGTGHLSLFTGYPSAGIAQLSADVSAQAHSHSERVGPASCAGVFDGSNDPYLKTTIWCKGMNAQVSGQESASGTIAGDGKSIDMTCSDSRTHDYGSQGNVTINTVEQVTVAGTLYIKPTDQASP